MHLSKVGKHEEETISYETNLFVISFVNSLVDMFPPTSLVVIPDSITSITVFSNVCDAVIEF